MLRKVDPVRIESLEKFGTPEEVGARVLKVEQGKDGTLETKLFGATSEKQGDLSLYTLVRRRLFENVIGSTTKCVLLMSGLLCEERDRLRERLTARAIRSSL